MNKWTELFLELHTVLKMLLISNPRLYKTCENIFTGKDTQIIKGLNIRYFNNKKNYFSYSFGWSSNMSIIIQRDLIIGKCNLE